MYIYIYIYNKYVCEGKNALIYQPPIYKGGLKKYLQYISIVGGRENKITPGNVSNRITREKLKKKKFGDDTKQLKCLPRWSNIL